MARAFLLLNLLNEAYSLGRHGSKQEIEIRKTRLLNKHKNFVRKYMLSEELVDSILEDIKQFLKQPKRQGRSLSFKVKLLCTLSFFTSGCYQKMCGAYNAKVLVSQASMSRCIHEIVNALSHPSIVQKYIRFPRNSEERQKLKEKFLKKYRIPGVIGCIDGTYVAHRRPLENEEQYSCIKGSHAINVQLITDADSNILYVDATHGAATHDSVIFNNSSIRNQLEGLVNAGETVYLLGNSAHVQQPYLMVPVVDYKQDTPEAHYNKLHADAYTTAERAISRLKRRFQCLMVKKMLHYHPEMVTKIVISCCVLHNMCNGAALRIPMTDDSYMQEEIKFRDAMGALLSTTVSHTESEAGQSSRQALIHSLWRA